MFLERKEGKCAVSDIECWSQYVVARNSVSPKPQEDTQNPAWLALCSVEALPEPMSKRKKEHEVLEELLS